MAKSNQTANEAQLKARRTSLGKKSNDELMAVYNKYSNIYTEDKTSQPVSRCKSEPKLNKC